MSVTNSEIAAQISTLVNRWNTRENQMVALLSQETGTVTVTDGLGRNHTLPSFPQLQKTVNALTDDLTGAVAQAQSINSQVIGMVSSATQAAAEAEASATLAQESAASLSTAASDAAASASAAATSAASAASSASAAAASESAASASAAAADTSKQAATASAAQAADSSAAAVSAASSASGSATAASTSAQSATSAATTATTAAGQAEASKNAAAVSASQAATSASSASSSADSASTSATTAGTKATQAANSASSAASSSTTATTAKNDAVAARDKAQAWANAAQGTEVEAGAFSAKHWALQAQAATTGTLVYMGAWDASTGAYPPAPNKGHFYKVTAGGTAGGVDYSQGDQIIFNGVDWDKVDNTEQVTRVAGRTGDVVLTKADVGLSSVDDTADAAKSVLSATKLTTGRSINGTSFNGTASITTATWGTSRNFTVGATAKAVNGASNVSWSLAEIGAAPEVHTHALGSLSDVVLGVLNDNDIVKYDAASGKFVNGAGSFDPAGAAAAAVAAHAAHSDPHPNYTTAAEAAAAAPLQSIAAGTGISIDLTDPRNPVVNVAGGGGLGDAPSDGKYYGRRNGAWEPVGTPGVVTITANTTLTTAHLNKILEVTVAGPVTITVPPGLGTQGDMVTIVHSHATGMVSISRGSGVSAYRMGYNGNHSITGHGMMSLYRTAANNVWAAA